MNHNGGMIMEKIALQMYSLRSMTKGNMIPVLEQVAKMGFDGAEFAGYDGLPAKELRKALDGMGMVAAGSHIAYELLRDSLSAVIDYSLEMGESYIVCPGVHVEKDAGYRDGWKRIAEEFNAIGEKVKAAGMIFGYHNHSHEFETYDGVRPYDLLFQNVCPELVKMQLDTCWVENAGYSAVDTMKLYAKHFQLLHIKELTKPGEPGDLPVGKGCIDFPAIIALGKEMGCSWYTIEYEAEGPQLLADIRESIRYLRSIT